MVTAHVIVFRRESFLVCIWSVAVSADNCWISSTTLCCFHCCCCLTSCFSPYLHW